MREIAKDPREGSEAYFEDLLENSQYSGGNEQTVHTPVLHQRLVGVGERDESERVVYLDSRVHV